jgi:hypothetical protein
MPLTQSLTLSTGVVVTYWVLTSLHLDTKTQIATICMSGYLDSTTFSNGNDPVTTTHISIAFVPTNILPEGATVLQALYTKIQLDPFFTESTYINDGV